MPPMTTTSNRAPLSISGNGRYFVDKQGQEFSTPKGWEDALLLLEGE